MPDEPLHYLTIREVGERLRRRELSPVELTSADPRPSGAPGRPAQRVHHDHAGAGAGAGPGRRAGAAGRPRSRAAPRHPDQPERPVPDGRRQDDRRLEDPGRLGADDRCDGHPAAPTGRRDRDRQEQPPRVRVRRDEREPALRAGPQPLEPRADHRADRAAARRRRWRPGSGTPRWARTRAARSGCRPRSAGWSGSSRRTGWSSRAGVLPLSWSLDHCGPLTRTVEDAAHHPERHRRARPRGPGLGEPGHAGPDDGARRAGPGDPGRAAARVPGREREPGGGERRPHGRQRPGAARDARRGGLGAGGRVRRRRLDRRSCTARPPPSTSAG